MGIYYKPGDVVQLHSGGLKMTVEEHLTDSPVRCVWMDNFGNMMHADINPTLLKSA